MNIQTWTHNTIIQTLNECVSLFHESSEPQRKYIQSRGLQLLDESSIKCHPHLRFKDSRGKISYHHALVFKVVDVGGQLKAIHRVYVSPDGKKITRRALGVLKGGAIRLEESFWNPTFQDDRLAVAEGIETAWSVYEGLAKAYGGLKTYSTISANGMRSFEIPSWCRQLLIFSDLDRNEVGQKAAHFLAARAAAAGIKAKVLFPPGEIPEGQKSLDFNDTHISSYDNATKDTPS